MTTESRPTPPPTSAAGRLRFALLLALALVPVDVLVAYTRARIPGSVPGEYLDFGPAGAALLRGDFGAVFAMPDIQGGPLELLPYGVAHLLHVHGVAGWTIFYVAVIFVLCLGFVSIALLPLSALRGRLVVYGVVVVGLVAILGAVLPSAVFLGHPADVVIPALWIAAGYYARRNQSVACAALIAASTGFEVWGLLGAPVILLAASPRFVRAALLGLVLVLALYLPLVIAGNFAMFRFRWDVSANSIYAAIDPGLTQFPWTLRLAQAVLAIAAGAATAVILRRSRHAIWVVPFSIIAVRLAVDPLLLSYYWLAPATVGLLACVDAVADRQWIAAAVSVVVVAATFVAPWRPEVVAIAFVVVAIAAMVGARRAANAGFRQ